MILALAALTAKAAAELFLYGAGASISLLCFGSKTGRRKRG